MRTKYKQKQIQFFSIQIISFNFKKSYTYFDTKPANSSFSLFISRVSVYTYLLTSSYRQAISPFCSSLMYKNCLMFSYYSAEAIILMFHILNNYYKVSSSITSICLIILVIDDLNYRINTLFSSFPNTFRSCRRPFRNLHQYPRLQFV